MIKRSPGSIEEIVKAVFDLLFNKKDVLINASDSARSKIVSSLKNKYGDDLSKFKYADKIKDVIEVHKELGSLEYISKDDLLFNKIKKTFYEKETQFYIKISFNDKSQEKNFNKNFRNEYKKKITHLKLSKAIIDNYNIKDEKILKAAFKKSLTFEHNEKDEGSNFQFEISCVESIFFVFLNTISKYKDYINRIKVNKGSPAIKKQLKSTFSLANIQN